MSFLIKLIILPSVHCIHSYGRNRIIPHLTNERKKKDEEEEEEKNLPFTADILVFVCPGRVINDSYSLVSIEKNLFASHYCIIKEPYVKIIQFH